MNSTPIENQRKPTFSGNREVYLVIAEKAGFFCDFLIDEASLFVGRTSKEGSEEVSGGPFSL